jgi:hypothetical protein
VLRASRVASSSEMRAQLAMQRLGLEVGAEYTGKCKHPFFRPYDLTFQLGKVMRGRPYQMHSLL